MQVKVLSFRMHNTASALWCENGQPSILGNFIYVDTWIRLCFLQPVYSLHYLMCAQFRVFFLETWNKLSSREDNV